MYGDDCATYKIKGFCEHLSDEQFKAYGKQGYHGGHCVECGCQGSKLKLTTIVFWNNTLA